MTTKTDKTQTAQAQAAAGFAQAFAPITQMLESLTAAQDKMQLPSATRDAVKRAAEAAKSRIAATETSVLNTGISIEKAITDVVGAGASLSRGLVDAAIANVTLTLGAVQSMVDASSPKDAAERYGVYLRDLGQANMTRATEAFDAVQKVAADGARTLQAEAGRLSAFGKAA